MNRITGAMASSAMALILCAGASAQAQGKSALRVAVPGAVHRSMKLDHTDPNRLLHVSVSLPYGDPEGMQRFVDSVSDPKSPNYHKYITPEEVGARFGLSGNKVNQVAAYLRSQGFKINLQAKNHLAILADCTVGQAEAAFGTVINDYQSQDPKEPGRQNFFSFSKDLQLPTEIASYVIDVSGLENYTKPQMRTILTPTQTRTLYNLAPIYNGGLQGQGRTIAISNFDGYKTSNIPLFYSQYGLPTPSGGVNSNVHIVTISGGNAATTPQGEGDLDIQMVLGQAPLCNFYIYDGGSSDLIGTLTREVNDNLADVISESYGWNLPAASATSAHNLHLSMTAQGITYMAASGDSGTTLEPYSYPNYDPEVLLVGGTVATTDASGNRSSEVNWTSGGGGWSNNTATFNTRPSWQTGTGVPTNVNHRLSPDIALHAGGSGAYYFYLNGSLASGYVGTSFACPVFAGGLGVAEQKIIANGGLPANSAGKQRFGRIQDLIYGQNGRSDVWFDITSGSNGTLPDGTTSSAHTGWDYCVGWGPINWNNFVATQGGSGPTVPAAPTGLSASAGNTQITLSWSGSTGATGYNVKRATVSGGPYTTVGSTASTSFTNTGLTNGTTYYYVVTATNTAGESGNSNQASGTPSGGGVAQQLLANPGFESGAVSWTQTSGVIDSSASEPAHAGSWKAWLNGYGTTHTDSLYQDVTIPSTATSATLSFWLHIDTAETTTTTAFDTFKIQIRNSANTVLATLATYSNLNKAAGYSQKSFNVLAYKGQTIRVYFLGAEDSSLQTSFVVDDTALNVQ